MRVGSLSIGLASVALVSLLVVSAGIAVVLIRSEARAGGMEDKWVLTNVDTYGNKHLIMLQSMDSWGNIIASDGWSNPPCLMAISADGALQWRNPVNSGAFLQEGSDGRYYYVDWADSDSGPWSNLTSLSVNGVFRWSYVVPNGTIELWAVYPDGVVVAHHRFQEQNMTTGNWSTPVDRVLALSRDGVELWTVDLPFDDASWSNPKIASNGTFVVYTVQTDGDYEFGITKYGTLSYLQKGEYAIRYMEPGWGNYHASYFEVRREAIDSETTVISVYAFDATDGSQEWKTVLGYSDNKDNLPPGGGWQWEYAWVNSHGLIFCDEMDAGNTYCLDLNGTIVWEKPYIGRLVGLFPSGNLLAVSDSWLKRVNTDGSTEWKHYSKSDGYTNFLIGEDDTIYYTYGTDVHALASSTGTSTNVVYLIAVGVVDVVAIAAYGLVRTMKLRNVKNP